MNIIDEAGLMPYLRWDSGSKQLRPSKESPRKLEEILHLVKDVRRLVDDQTTTLRFHSLVKNKDSELDDRAHPWLWMITSRHQDEAWNSLRQLCYHAVWLLIRAQIRPSGPEKSNLAKEIQKRLSQG